MANKDPEFSMNWAYSAWQSESCWPNGQGMSIKWRSKKRKRKWTPMNLFTLDQMTNACHKALSLKLENVHVTRKCNQKCEHISIVLRAGLATVL